MKLKYVKRLTEKKSEAKKLRREGFVPAVLYVRGKPGETIAIEAVEFKAFLRNVESGHLPTSIFILVDEQGNEKRALVKDIQYNIINYDVIHLDFEELIPGQKVNLSVPIKCNDVGCIGIKLGGVLRQPIRHARVRCLPDDIPSFFELDVRELNLRQSKRLSDINIPETIRPLMKLNEVVAVIVKR